LTLTLSPPTPPRVRAQSRKRTVVAYFQAGVKTDKIARLTHLSRRRVTAILRESMAQSLRDTSIEEVRLRLYVELQELLAVLQDAFFFDDDLSPRERGQLVSSIVKVVHEQALVMGLHAPRQVAVVNEQPVENEQAAKYARDLVTFMNLCDKIAASGYGSGRSPETLDTELLLEADAADSPLKPELLRQFEAGELATEPRPRRVESGKRERGRSRKVEDDDDDD
jgi:hypothetical protein